MREREREKEKAKDSNKNRGREIGRERKPERVSSYEEIERSWNREREREKREKPFCERGQHSRKLSSSMYKHSACLRLCSDVTG